MTVSGADLDVGGAEGLDQLDALIARAGDLLRGDDVEAADRQVTEALRLAPDDLRARNLLGLVRFRAGRYEDAYRVYRELVARDPDDSALRLNLGLVELRMGRNAEAARSLRRVVAAEPNNLKARGYFGLALMRAGDLVAARDAFVAAEQPDLVRQIDERLEAAAQPVDGAAAAVGPAGAGVGGEAGDEELLRIDASATEPAPAWPVPRPAVPLGRFLDRHGLAVPAGEPFAISPGGLLVVHVDGRTPMRTLGAIASSGRLAYAPLTRRVRGRSTDQPWNEGDDAMVTASGNGLVVLSPRGLHFSALRLVDQAEVLYVREAAVVAFEEALSWENGRVPGGGALEVVQFRGQGRVALRLRQAPSALRLAAGEVLYVEQAALVGWTGQVVPKHLRGLDGGPTQFIACSGEGALILEEPGPAAPETARPPA